MAFYAVFCGGSLLQAFTDLDRAVGRYRELESKAVEGSGSTLLIGERHTLQIHFID